MLNLFNSSSKFKWARQDETRATVEMVLLSNLYWFSWYRLSTFLYAIVYLSIVDTIQVHCSCAKFNYHWLRSPHELYIIFNGLLHLYILMKKKKIYIYHSFSSLLLFESLWHCEFYITLIVIQYYKYSNNCEVITQFRITFSLLVERPRREKRRSSHDVANHSTSFKPRLNIHRVAPRSSRLFIWTLSQRISNNCHLYLISYVLTISEVRESAMWSIWIRISR